MAEGPQTSSLPSPSTPTTTTTILNPLPPAPVRQGCRARAFARCDCAFHRREAERGVEAIARRIRADAAPLAAARAAAAVFQREAGAADAYVAARAAELGGAPGARLHWCVGMVGIAWRRVGWEAPRICGVRAGRAGAGRVWNVACEGPS